MEPVIIKIDNKKEIFASGKTGILEIIMENSKQISIVATAMALSMLLVGVGIVLFKSPMNTEALKAQSIPDIKTERKISVASTSHHDKAQRVAPNKTTPHKKTTIDRADSYVVQVATFKNISNAQNMKTTLSKEYNNVVIISRGGKHKVSIVAGSKSNAERISRIQKNSLVRKI